jgi:hypothetical protein
MTPAMEWGAYRGDLPFRGFSMHPNGKSFMTSVLRMKGDIWVIENFARPRARWWRW